MKALAHNVMHIQLQVTVNKKCFIYQVRINVAKQRLPIMISSEFTYDYDVRLKSERKIFKFVEVLVSDRSIYISGYAYSITSFLDMFTARLHSLYLL